MAVHKTLIQYYYTIMFKLYIKKTNLTSLLYKTF